MSRSIEDVLADMQDLVDGAKGRPLTDAEISNYETFEVELKSVQRDAEIRNRDAAYRTPAGNPIGVPKPHVNELDLAFENLIRTGKPNADLTGLQISNAQSEGSGPEGGYLVPDSFRQKLVDRMVAFGGIANQAETITTGDGRPLPWATIDDTANVGEVVDEGGTWTSGADMVFGTASLNAWEYATGGAGSNPIRVSTVLLQDAAFNIQGLVSAKLGERLARIQAQHLVTGNGVKQPTGLVHGLTGVELAADTAGITYNDLVTFIHSVDPAYRASNCRWAFNDNTLEIIRKMEDSNNDPLWRPDNADMATGLGGGTLMGFPVTIDQSFPDVDVDANTVNWGVFGDIREGYVIRRVRSIVLVVNPWARANYRQVEYSAWARMDATQQNTNAYVALTGEQ